jgi:hypothetical protein
MSNFSSLPMTFCQFFTWIALDDADLRFSLIANAGEEETQWATWLYHQCYQSIHMTVGMTLTSLSASLLQKISSAMDCPCQIALNWKLSRILERWCKFSVCVKAKSCTKKLCKTRPACINILFIVHWFCSDFRWTYSVWKHRYFVQQNALLLWTLFTQILGVRTSKGNIIPLEFLCIIFSHVTSQGSQMDQLILSLYWWNFMTFSHKDLIVYQNYFVYVGFTLYDICKPSRSCAC